MGKLFEEITPELAEWIGKQHLFFVASAPLAETGLVNCSPKGMDTFRVLGPGEVAYLDFTGSGIETAAHLHENGRIVVMFCALSGPPKILRLHGTGEYLLPTSKGFKGLRSHFQALPGVRGIVRIAVKRIADSCGYAVPRFDYSDERDTLLRWAESKGVDALAKYRHDYNAVSLDGLPGIEEEE